MTFSGDSKGNLSEEGKTAPSPDGGAALPALIKENGAALFGDGGEPFSEVGEPVSEDDGTDGRTDAGTKNENAREGKNKRKKRMKQASDDALSSLLGYASEPDGEKGTEAFSCRMYESKGSTSEGKGFHVRLDWHEYAEILYFSQGQWRLTLNLRQIDIAEECFYFLNPGDLHRIDSLSDVGLEYSVCFDYRMLRSYLQDEGERDLILPLLEQRLRFSPCLSVSDIGYMEILEAFRSLVKRFHGLGSKGDSIPGSKKYTVSGAAPRILIKAELLKIIALMESCGRISADSGEEEKQIKIIKDAVEYIQDNYRNKIYIRDLAKLTNLNEQYFIRLFGNYVGIPPLEYINRYRVDRAREMLCGNNGRIYDIAEACGFHNIGNFIKIFSTYTGMTPHKYRKGLE